MNLLQRIFGKTGSVANLTGIQDWQKYEAIIPQKELIYQYYGATARAIKIKSDAVSAHEPKLYRRLATKTVELKNTPLQRDLQHFNSFQSFTEARKLTQIYKSLMGVAFWLMLESRTTGYNVEFYILNPNNVQYYTVNDLGFPTAYKYTDSNGKEMIIPDEFIVMFRNPNPVSYTGGHSDVQSSRYAHNSYELAMNFNMNYFGNLARPEVILEMAGVSADNLKRFESAFLSKFRGTKKAGKTAFVNHEVKIHELTKTMQDMQFKEGIELMREEIFASHGIPKELALGSGTYQNVREAQRIFQLYTLQPELEAEADILNEQLIPKYYRTSVKDQLFVADNSIEADKKSDAEIANLLSKVELSMPGTFSKNEIRSIVGLEPIKGGEEYVVPVVETQAKEVKQVKKKFNKARYIKRVDKFRDGAELKIEKQIDKYFAKQKKEIVAQINKMGKPSLDYDFDQVAEAQKLQKILTPVYFALAEDFQNLIMQELGNSEQSISTEYQAMLEAQIEELAFWINTTTGKDLLAVFIEAIENNWNSKALADSIVDVFDKYGEGIETTRAKTIARTESTKTTSWISNNIYLNDPTVTRKEWTSARDADTREEHLRADGQIVDKNEPFEVGGELLMYPGDPNGSAWNIINCRCVEAPVVS